MRFRHYPTDPVLRRANFRCEYCGVDMLGDLDRFLTLVRDHFIPRSIGGPDGSTNRVCSCAACDRIKRDRVFETLDEAREFILQYRRNVTEWLAFVRSNRD